MSDMSKPAVTEDCAEEECTHPGAAARLCVNGKHHVAMPGSRSWFWLKRFEQVPLFILPVVPVLMAADQALHPTAGIRLSGAQRAALNGQFSVGGHQSTTITEVTVRLDGASFLDRVQGAGPALALAVVAVFLAYTLWRVEVNMTAGGRPFTTKDHTYLRRAQMVLTGSWLALLVLEIGGISWLHFGPAGLHHAASPMRHAVWVVFGLMAVVASLGRVYAKGKTAYEELETIV